MTPSRTPNALKLMSTVLAVALLTLLSMALGYSVGRASWLPWFTENAPAVVTVGGIVVFALCCVLTAMVRLNRQVWRALRAASGEYVLNDYALLNAYEARARAGSTRASVPNKNLRDTAIQEERNRLARDLHDTIKQQLFGINMAVATAQAVAGRDRAALDAQLAQIASLTEQAQIEMTALLTQLRPRPLATLGLIEAIRDQLEALRFRSEVHVAFQSDALPDETQLPVGAQEAIFRIVQEALSNIARHARARNVSVAIEHVAGAFVLMIRDDGQGFDPRAAGGMGLNNMRLRAREIGGALDIDAAPGRGAHLTLRVPLQIVLAPLSAEEKLERGKALYGVQLLAALAIGVPLWSLWLFAHRFFVALRAGLPFAPEPVLVGLVVGSLVLMFGCLAVGFRRLQKLRARCGAVWKGGPWRTSLLIQQGQSVLLLVMLFGASLVALDVTLPGYFTLVLASVLMLRCVVADAELSTSMPDWSTDWLPKQEFRDAWLAGLLLMTSWLLAWSLDTFGRPASSMQSFGFTVTRAIWTMTIVFALTYLGPILLVRWRRVQQFREP